MVTLPRCCPFTEPPGLIVAAILSVLNPPLSELRDRISDSCPMGAHVTGN
jgi:hypothetical protein